MVEASDITAAGGGVVLTSSVGATPTYLSRAEKVIIELNACHPRALLGMHDIFEPQDPPTRQEVLIDLTAVDWMGREPRFEVVYQLKSLSRNAGCG